MKTNFGKAHIFPAVSKLLICPLLEGISQLYQLTPDSLIINILSLVAPHFPPSVLREYGLNASASQVQRAKRKSLLKKATLMGYTRTIPESKKKISVGNRK